MPRPRKNPDEVLCRELRITPPNGNDIEDWCLDERIVKFVAFKEGGLETGKKVHYHCYIETTMTAQALPKWIYTLVGCIQTGEKGNAVFFSRQPHTATMGYIAKGRDCVIRHNYSQTHIEEWFTQSDTYVKQRGTLRKREQRTRQDELMDVIKLVEKDLHADRDIRTVKGCVDTILRYCHHSDIRFPSRSQMELFVVKLLYPYDQSIVSEYYMRSFPKLFPY